VAFDLPTQMGYDSDDPVAHGEVGKVGVAIDSIEDMELLMRGIPQDRVTTSMTINAPASVLLLLYELAAEHKGIAASTLGGTIQNDILKEYAARGTYIYPPRQSMRLVTDTFAYCAEHLPRWNTISISGYHIREAGATAPQEIAFTLSNGIAYVQAAIDAGLDVEDFGPRLSFFFNVSNDFFEEVAKFRAARALWAELMRERFGATGERSLQLRFHAQTSGATLTAQQPLNNVVRVSLQALAAVCGGAQSLHTNSYDEALALPSEQAAEIQESAYRHQRLVESGDRVIVGVNRFTETSQPTVPILTIGAALEAAQVERLAKLRAARSAGDVGRALDALRAGAQGTANLLPLMRTALEARATVGEVCGVLREVFGAYRPPVTV
jgi:methylmalonyl-CoA mutase N-terminal domain/subunit